MAVLLDYIMIERYIMAVLRSLRCNLVDKGYFIKYATVSMPLESLFACLYNYMWPSVRYHWLRCWWRAIHSPRLRWRCAFARSAQ